MKFSDKQKLSISQATKRFNIWCGAVRSGKTYASIIKLIDRLKNGPPGDVMIVGVNRATIQRNVLNEMYRLLAFPPPSSKVNEAKLYNHNLYFVGANDEGAVRSIQGATLACAYVDEAACIPAAFWKMLQSRISIAGAQLIATCNPEGPNHWLKKEYIDRAHELDLIHWTFVLDDNPSLDERYKNALKSEYTGMWYKRYILGEWAVAHGLIYDAYDHNNLYENPSTNASYYIGGCDYGTSNATAAVLLAITPNQWPQIRVESEYYYDSAKRGRSKTDAELADDLKEFCHHKNLQAFYIDPSAASLKLELRNRNLPVLDAKNDVLLGIKITAKFIAGKNIVIHKSCSNLIDCIQSYCWDPKAADRGEDKPLKEHEHICIVGDTIISGIPDKRISDLEAKKKNGYIFNYNENKKRIEIDMYKNPTLTRKNAEVWKLELENGQELIATPDHQVMTQKGWMCLKDLTLCDIVLTWNTKSTSEENSIKTGKQDIGSPQLIPKQEHTHGSGSIILV